MATFLDNLIYPENHIPLLADLAREETSKNTTIAYRCIFFHDVEHKNLNDHYYATKAPKKTAFEKPAIQDLETPTKTQLTRIVHLQRTLNVLPKATKKTAQLWAWHGAVRPGCSTLEPLLPPGLISCFLDRLSFSRVHGFAKSLGQLTVWSYPNGQIKFLNRKRDRIG